MRTVGIAAKVKWPAVVEFALGCVLLIVGYVIGDNTVTAIGYAAICASGITSGVGFAAPAAGLTSPDHPSAPKRGPQA